MPSPVIGLTRPAASPTSSTRPVGLLPAPGAEGQVVSAPVGAGARHPGQELLELLEQQPPARRAALAAAPRQQLAVADVGEAVAAVERPGVRRLRALAVADHLTADQVRGRRRVAADRERALVASSSEQRGAHERVGAVGADDHGRDEALGDQRPPGLGRDGGDPVAAQDRAGGHGLLDEAGVEHPARHDVGLAAHRPRDTYVAAGQLQVAQRRPAVDDVGGADLGEHGRSRAGRSRRRRTCRAGSRCGRAAAPAGSGRR